jgi:small subunit ribosomal protein S8
MSMSDPISDMLTRIRNAQMVGKEFVSVSLSKLKVSILNVLQEEGYIASFLTDTSSGKGLIKISLKYYAGRPVIERISRVSRPGLRVYKGKNDIPSTTNGLGVTILTTSKGILTDRKARQMGLGGEILCSVV